MFSDKKSLWIRWLHAYCLKGRDIWQVRPTSDCSVFWTHMLKVRTLFSDAIHDHVWDCVTDQKFSMKLAYSHVVENFDLVRWHSLVWNSVPKLFIVCWFAILDKLPTLDRLGRCLDIISNSYALCLLVDESQNHLFFECSYSWVIWHEIMCMIKLHDAPWRWNRCWQ